MSSNKSKGSLKLKSVDGSIRKPWRYYRNVKVVADSGHDLSSLGMACGVSMTHISQIFSDHTSKMPSFPIAKKIADALDITLDDLWDVIEPIKKQYYIDKGELVEE